MDLQLSGGHYYKKKRKRGKLQDNGNNAFHKDLNYVLSWRRYQTVFRGGGYKVIRTVNIGSLQNLSENQGALKRERL